MWYTLDHNQPNCSQTSISCYTLDTSTLRSTVCSLGTASNLIQRQYIDCRLNIEGENIALLTFTATLTGLCGHGLNQLKRCLLLTTDGWNLCTNEETDLIADD